MDQHVEAVKHYIREHTRAGTSTDIAIQQLRTAGWPEPYIQQALHELQAEAAPAAPITPAMPGAYPQPQPAYPAQVAASTLAKATLNPFRHIGRGIARLLRSNITATIGIAIGIIVINIVLAIAMVVVFFAAIFSLDSAGIPGNTAPFPMPILGIVAAIVVIYLLLNGYIVLVLNRLVLLSSRQERSKFGQLVRFSLRRYPKVILTYLFITVVAMLAFGITIGAAALPQPLGVIFSVVLGVAAVVFAVIYGLRISFINLVIADTPEPGSPMNIIRSSRAVWHRSVGAVLLYSLTAGGIYILLSIVSSALSPLTRLGSTPASSGLPWLAAVPAFLFPTLLFTAMQIGTAAGLADIYTEAAGEPARQLL